MQRNRLFPLAARSKYSLFVHFFKFLNDDDSEMPIIQKKENNI